MGGGKCDLCKSWDTESDRCKFILAVPRNADHCQLFRLVPHAVNYWFGFAGAEGLT